MVWQDHPVQSIMDRKSMLYQRQRRRAVVVQMFCFCWDLNLIRTPIILSILLYTCQKC